MEKKEARKEFAKRKRLATELAGQVHDIVEERLWDDYTKLPNLSEQLVKAVNEAMEFKKAHNL